MSSAKAASAKRQSPSSTENDIELQVVGYLVRCLERRLGDRGSERHEPGWEPRQNVVLGVLESVVVQSDAHGRSKKDGDAEPPTEVELAVPDDADLPTMGLDFAVETSSDEISLQVNISFAIYAEEYPTADEQRSYARPEDSRAELAVPSGTDDSADAGGESTSATSAAAGGDADHHQRKRTRLVSVWRRYDIQVDGIALVVPTNGEQTVESEAIERAVNEVIDAHFARSDAAKPFKTRTREVASSALASGASFREAIREAESASFTPLYPKLRLVAFAQRLTGESFLVSLSLLNATVLPERPFQDLAVYDSHLDATIEQPSRLVPQRFHLGPADYRYAEVSDVVGHGRGCVAVPTAAGGVGSTTLPQFDQRVVRPREDHVPAPRWAELGKDPTHILGGIESAMHDYLAEWDDFLSHSDTAVAQASHRERDRFEAEIQRFGLGRRAMAEDERLSLAFRLTNRVFADLNKSADFDTWRLFQLVFIVSHLPALAAREHRDDKEFMSELDYADVLWFPTGGGKTEAYLGLIVCALFYDRLRGKARGATAWLKFPLRMLSVQQLSRVLRVLVVADRFRLEELGSAAGDPFELGYLVGGSNTPNQLIYPAEWWPGIKGAGSLDERVLNEHRLVVECPFCTRRDVRLRVDLLKVRLIHHCEACGKDLPLHMTDDEVYRYMPSVLVGTVDKLSGFAFYGEFTQLAHGPRFRCPVHGWFTFPRNGKCLAGDSCTEESYVPETAARWHDPVPALVVQDELHLLREELGAFDAHYEGLFAELQEGGPSRLPSKMLAASATIEQFEDQLRQVYGRRPRSFPAPGFARERSFYTVETSDTRRVFLGVLPHYRRKADVAGIVQAELLEQIRKLQDMAPDEAAAALGGIVDPSALAALLFLYEVSLAYVNSKPNGDQIADELARLSERFESLDGDRIFFRVLTGQVGISELAAAIDHVEQDKVTDPRSGRLQALVGTSVVSHGVDLSRLNVMTLAGLPATVADYIQATSRSGRAHVGFVVTVFDVFSRRERSTFTNFFSFHRFLDRMVEPVPVNKYARFGADRTLPGIVMGLLWDLCRDDTLGGPSEGIRRTRWLSKWWNARAVDIKPRLEDRIERAYRSRVPGVNEPTLEDELVERVLHRWTHVEMPTMQRFDADRTTQLFRERVLASFRDVDLPVEFGARPFSEAAFESLTGSTVAEGQHDAA